MPVSKSRSNVKRRSTVWLSIGGVAVLAVIAGTLVAVALDNQTPPVEASALRYTIPPEPTRTATATPLPTASALPVATITRTDDPLKVLFVGDSLADSVAASVESKGFLPTMVTAWEKTGAVTLTQGQYSDDDDSAEADLVDIGEDQDVVVLELGTKDVGKTDIDTFTRDYKSLLTTIVTASPGAKLICAGVWQEPEIAVSYDAVIAEQCAARGGTFRPLSDLQSTEANRGPAGQTGFVGGTSDTLHPNDTGYAAIAKRLLGAIKIA